MALPDAAARTLELVPESAHAFGDHEVSVKHVRSFLEQVINESVAGLKAHRYLGFAQGVIAAYTEVTLDDFRTINRESQVDEPLA